MRPFRIFIVLLFAFSISVHGQVPPTYNSSEILLKMKKLGVLGSVLYIAAHPDDENNALLPYLANEKLYRTAYLSLTRGDGGQNLIGDEQGIELGIIRTQELIAARKVDGAEQYFTRAYEFGFSKSAEEALRIWDREKVLADMVWVIRKFQPDIIIKRFPPDSRAGHGHHAASALLADEAFVAAADPSKFKEQFAYGVKPWQAKRLLWNVFNFGGQNTTLADQLKIDIGVYNPLLGKSYGEIGGEARTMHKSQGEGRPRRRGPIFEYFSSSAGAPLKNDLMDDIDLSWQKLEAGAAVSAQITKLVAEYQPSRPEASLGTLIKINELIRGMQASTWTIQKQKEVQSLIEACAALFSEAITLQEQSVQGDSIRLTFSFNKRTDIPVTVKRLRLENFDSSLSFSLQTNQNQFFNTTIRIAPDKAISQPYWLQYPIVNGIFDVRDQNLIGNAENEPSLLAEFSVNIMGQDFLLKRPLQYKIVDPVKGEVYQPVAVLPILETGFTKENYISINGKTDPIVFVDVHSNKTVGIASAYKMQSSANWQLAKPSGQVKEITNDSRIQTAASYKGKDGNSSGELTVSLQNESSGNTYDVYKRVISYDHIPTQTYFAKAKANLLRLNIKTNGKKIGYVSGAGDKIPAALESLGYDVKIISEKDVSLDYLKQFDAIVTGIRAYNMHEWLSSKNDVFMKYVENGGNMIVQYLKSNQVGNSRVKVGPYKFSVDPSTRVTEEDAEISFLLPDHPVLHYPNEISKADFTGWVQERSTYQAIQADSNYVMPLSMNDRSEKPSAGSLAIAKYGRGNFVYASLVFFRQLPAGNPGAYRLFANLLALPANRQIP
jgi:LmbE family N-acetylglucosaminyl deacetylase